MSAALNHCPACDELTEQLTCRTCGRPVERGADRDTEDQSDSSPDVAGTPAAIVQAGARGVAVDGGVEADDGRPDWRQYRSPRNRGQHEGSPESTDNGGPDSTAQSALERPRTPRTHYWHTC